MANLITSQDYIDQDTVEQKLAAGDFDVMVSPEFEVEGETYQVILDGHHSYEAAKQAGVDPVLHVATPTAHDAIALLSDGKIDEFLEVTHMGSDYRYADTGVYVW